jgi:peptidoglycan-N-acetylglucosamine deacetylase
MPGRRFPAALLGGVMLMCFSAGVAAPAGLAAPAGVAPPSEIALTFDDLPAHGPLPPQVSRADVARAIVLALKHAHAPPVYGFVNAIALTRDPSAEQALAIWRKSGNLLGNHTYSHADPNVLSAEAFEADVTADEPILKKYMTGKDWHWLRLPYLRGGNTPAKRAAIRDFLVKNDYRLADETVYFNDYDYNAPYVRCLAKNDAAGLQWLKQHYLQAAARTVDTSRSEAKRLFGRDIKHVFLLHIGVFDAKMLPEVLAMLTAKNFKLIDLPEAESDPAYAAYGEIRDEWGGTLLARAMAATGNWFSAPPENTGPALDKLCR